MGKKLGYGVVEFVGFAMFFAVSVFGLPEDALVTVGEAVLLAAITVVFGSVHRRLTDL